MLSDQLIAKRGPLARVWLASHWERKISKSQFLQTNLEKTIDAIATKEQELLTLRISGQLLLGIVRIYSRKTRYLLEDCNEALVKIKLAFKKGDVNMPDIHHSVASLKSITLPEKLTEFDILLPDEPFADIDIDPKDPMFDSLSQLASSQDITLSDFDGLSQIAPRQDITLGGTQELDDGFAHINHGQVEQGMSFMEAEYGHVDDLEIGFDLDIENPRRDNDPELSAQFEDSFDRMSIKDNQQHDQQQFDPDFGVDYDFGDYDLNPADDVRPEDNAETFDQRAVDPMGSSQSTLMQSGVVPDFDDNMLFEETQMAEAPAPVRRRRRLIVDRVTEIPHEECRKMFNDTSAIVNRNINRRTAAKKKQQKIDWTKPAASPEGSSLFQIMNRKRAAGTLDEPMSPKEPRLDGQDEMTVADEPAQPVTENNEERDNNATAGGPDMDFDLDFGPDNWDDSVPIDPQGDAANPEKPLDEGAANMSIYSQSSQSTIGQNSRETLELVQTKAAGAGNTKFQDIAPSSCTKSEAAKKFYSVLLLTTKRMVKVHQQRPFGDIQISL